MITKISYRLAHFIAFHADRELDEDYIRYGLEVTLSVVSKVLFFLVISLILGIFKELFALILSFVLFRIVSGGAHMSTYLRCLTSSTILLVLPTIIFAFLLNDFTSIYVTIPAFIFGMITVMFYVPSSTSNRPIAQDKHSRFKWISTAFLLTWFIFSILIEFYLLEYHYLTLYSGLGILIQSFTIIPFGYKLLHNIDTLLNDRKNGGVKFEKGI